MSKIFCAQCHTDYDEKKILAYNGVEDGERPWSEVKPGQSSKRGLLRRKSDGLNAVEAIAAGYQPYCPAGHLLVEALFDALDEPYATIGVIGNLSSSKTCFIASLFASVARLGLLGGIGITASTFQSQDSLIDEQIHSIYVAKQAPAVTKVDAPTVGQVLRLQWPDGRRMNLVFYDIAGEVITNMQATAARARYVYSSRAFIMLLDPDGFPRPGAFLETVGSNQLVTSAQVSGLADGFEQVRGVRPSSMRLPLLMTVAKADKVQWTDGAWPPPADLSRLSVDDLLEYLAMTSAAVEGHLADANLGNVVNTARAKFGRDNVHFSRFSALGRDFDGGNSGTPLQAVGTWQVVVQLLDALGLMNALVAS